MQRMLRTWLALLVALVAVRAIAQQGPGLIENRGQWPDAVTHRAELAGATVWLERGSILIDRFDQEAMEATAHAHIHAGTTAPTSVRHHAFRLRFLGTRPARRIESTGVRRGTYNYLIGNDPEHWGRQCHAFSAVVQHHIHQGIDLRTRVANNGVKYDLIIGPGADPTQIVFTYDGVDAISVAPEQLTLRTSLGEFIERIPIAYQEIAGERKVVSCTYRSTADGIGFQLGPYDPEHPVVIDPTLVFSTYSGSFANNFGYTATFDRDGFLYSGSSAFGQGYPTTLGAYQVVHAGGHGLHDGIDMALTKYDTTGTALIWSTYLGGSSDELPHSLVVNTNDELFVYGTTSSIDFPVTSNSFDTSFNGGTALNLTNGIGANYPNGSDIVVARLNAAGTDLVASTYFGGTGNDGMNTAAGLKFNYADEIRGEVLLDSHDNVYIVSSTASADLPVTNGAVQPTFGGGGQDGVLVKMDASLSTLFWCSYFGGSQADAVYNIELDGTDGIYIAGGTRSPDLPVTANALQATFQGGIVDGFVAHLDADGSTVLACTYFGSPAYDQCYFADLDQQGDIYLFGQTQAPSTSFIVNAPYSVPNAGQFITKLNPSLSTILLSTRFGQGDGLPDISPSAFLVDYCNKIYVSGWGSTIQSGSLSTAGLPVTADAFQATTDGNDFYLAVFDTDLSDLYYATFFGGSISAEHVDGGTSRFDRRGRIYQSVCAGCGGSSDLPIAPDGLAWSPTNNSGLCNNAVFKFDMDFPIVVADFNSTVNCLPAPVSFTNLSYGAASYQWDFGDNTSSTDPAPDHVYPQPGVYTVRLIATNEVTCNHSDTTYRQVVVLGLGSYDLPDTTLCPGQSAQIGITPITAPDIIYEWTPAVGLSNTHVPNPVATPPSSTTYTLTISNGTCSTTVQQTITVATATIDAGPDQHLCGPSATTQLVATGNGSTSGFHWSSSSQFSDMLNTVAEDSTATATITHDAWFYVRPTGNACGALDSVFIDLSLGGIHLQPVEALCAGDTGAVMLFGADPGSTIHWTPEDLIRSGQGTARIWIQAPTSTMFHVEVTTPTGCTWSDSTQVVVSPLDGTTILATATPPLLIGAGTVQLEAFPSGLMYQWTPSGLVSNDAIADPTASITATTLFTVQVSDGVCAKDAQVLVEVRELICDGPDIFVPNTFTPNGDGQNDVLYVRGRNIASMQFMVFDRWGEKVFESTRPDHGWDGLFEGKPVDPAVFVYHLSATCVDGQAYFNKGNITVVR